MKTVYFFAVDKQGHESDPVEISLGPDGAIDISNLPQDIQQTFVELGIQNALHTGALFPKDGQAFLDALLKIAHSAWRFRTSPEKLF